MRFKDVIAAHIAASNFEQDALSRLAYWVEALGERDPETITTEEVEIAWDKLAERGRLKSDGKGGSIATGRPLADSTLNRYISQLGTVYAWAKKKRLVPRGFVSPTLAIERKPEPADPERYINGEEFEKILAVARVFDKRWGKLCALAVVCFHSGLRVGNVLNARGKDLDLEAGTLFIPKTKNGDPITVTLTSRAVAELRKLPKVKDEERIFGNRSGARYHYRPLWNRVVAEAGLAGKNIHQLRHGFGYMVAKSGCNQVQLMKLMNHRTLVASTRYAHVSVNDRRELISRVFG